jgi:alpha-tubulin suppressor-like RCC1 family protein
MLVEGLAGVRCIAAYRCSLAVTHSGAVFSWGRAFQPEAKKLLRPIIVEGFGGVRVRSVYAVAVEAFALAFASGKDKEVFSWVYGEDGCLGHGDTQNQPSPKRIEALRGVLVSSTSFGVRHALALAEDGLMYSWGGDTYWTLLGNPHVRVELLPKPIEALRGVRVGSIAAAGNRSYAVADMRAVGVGWGERHHSNRPRRAA